MKGVVREITAQLAPLLIMLAVVGIVGLLVWRKLFGDKTASDVAGDTAAAAATIPGGLVSLVDSKLVSHPESDYITREQQTANAAAQLALKRAAQGL